MGRNHSLRKVYRCVMSLPWESWWSMNAIRFVFCDWTKKSRNVDLLLQMSATQEILVSVVICLNFVVIIIEANYGAECDGNMTSHASMLIPPNLAPVETGWHLTLLPCSGKMDASKCGKMPGGCVPGWLSVINYCFVAFYTLEAFVAWRLALQMVNMLENGGNNRI